MSSVSEESESELEAVCMCTNSAARLDMLSSASSTSLEDDFLAMHFLLLLQVSAVDMVPPGFNRLSLWPW